MTTRRIEWLAALAIVVTAIPVAAQDAPAGEKAAREKPAPRRSTRTDHRFGPKSYMGRPIADVMSFLGADWLFRPEREDEEQPDQMLDALGLQPGWTVADVGAGAGYTSLRLAQRVGPQGVVLSTDIQPQMLQMLRGNAREAGFTNIKPILCTSDDPKLPEGKVDLALMVDVYHEMSNPEASLKGLHRALKPGGKLVLVEFRAEDPDVPIKPEHKMTVDQVRKEIEPKGFTFKEVKEFLRWQHIIIFEKAAAPKPAESK